MAKQKKSGGIALGDVVRAEMKDPRFVVAYRERTYVHEIARAVRAMRESAGLSQTQLAELIGTKQPAIARLETSQYSTPQWQTVHRIASALHKQLDLSLGEVAEGNPVVRIVEHRAVRRSSAGGVSTSR